MAAGGRRFLCLLLFSSVLFSSLAHAREASGKDGTEPDAVTVGQDRVSLKDNAYFEQLGLGYRSRGRKLVVRVENEITKLVEGGSDGLRTGTSAEVARANHQIVTRCEGRVRQAGERCKQRLNGRFSHEEVDGANFVAFNADYNAPRHHPPKNN